jgi:aquaporin NIP
VNPKFAALFRIVVGIAQMTMAVVTLGLYFDTGVNRWSIGSLVVTVLLVAGSRIAFESGPGLSGRGKKYVAEFIGTFALVFAGTGAIVIDEASHGAITHVGVALTFGLIVLVMIYALGDISGAHLNPAVTIGFWISRRLPGRELLPYIVSQCAGALAASGLMRLLFPDNLLLGATQPAGSELQSFILEFLLTALLMFVILGVSTGASEKGITAGIVVGSVIALEAMFAGPICGASMNPARSLGPAVGAGHFASLWLYLAGPVLGAALGVIGCRCVRDAGCCSRAEQVVSSPGLLQVRDRETRSPASETPTLPGTAIPAAMTLAFDWANGQKPNPSAII